MGTMPMYEMQVVNKYLLASGACPKSYGPTVAWAAGVPGSVTRRAAEISELFEQGKLPVEPEQIALLTDCSEGFSQGVREAWEACRSTSAPDLAALQQLQLKIANLEPT